MPQYVGEGWYRFGVDEKRSDHSEAIWGNSDGEIRTGHTAGTGKVYLLFECGENQVGLLLDVETMRHLANDLLGACERAKEQT